MKISGPKQMQPTPFYSPNENICVASALEEYVEQTQKLRDSCSFLFISFKQLQDLVTTRTLSRWAETALAQSGIDMEMFSAYSARDISVVRKSGLISIQ